MTEKFSDLLQFTTQVSRLMVTEIRRRASNKSTGICHRNQPKLIYLKRQFGKSAIKTKQKIDPVLSPEALIQFPIPFLAVTCFCWYQHLLLSSGVGLLPTDHCCPCPHRLTHSVSFWTKSKFLAWHSAQTQGLEIHTHTYTLWKYTHTQTLWKYTNTHACMCAPAYPFLFLVIFFCYISVYFNQNKLLIVLCVLFFPIPVMHHRGRSISPIPVS